MRAKASMALWRSVRVPTSACPEQLADSNIDLHKQALNNQWMEPAEDEDGNPSAEFRNYRGVALQLDDGNYTVHPSSLHEDLVEAFLRLDVPVGLTMSSETTAALLREIYPDQRQLGNPQSGITLPIIDSVESLAPGRVGVTPDNFICLCRKEQLVLIWGDSVCTSHNISSFGTNRRRCIG